MTTPPHIVITGPMGVGKTTTAIAVGQTLGIGVRDSDTDIEALFGRTGGSMADDLGVDELHRLEAAMLLGSLAADSPTVISAAAWVVEDPRCREALVRRAFVVVLLAAAEVLAERIATGAHRRDMPREEIEELTIRRSDLFAEVADLTLDATQDTSRLVSAIVDARRSGLGPAPSAAQSVEGPSQ